MPGVIEPETIEVNDLPPIWAPVQGPLSDADRVREVDEQATASLLWAATVPEQILRLLIRETDIDSLLAPPPGYSADEQGEWNPGLLSFGFRRQVELVREERSRDRLLVEYRVDGAGSWLFEFTPDQMTVGRI